MSGCFSADWLALRAVADRRARAPNLLSPLRRRLTSRTADGKPLRIVDLGAGTGSTLRVVAPLLPAPQYWTLIDNDPALLAAAKPPPHVARTIVIRPVRADLSQTCLLPGLLHDAAVITASALFDLVSEDWCRRLLRAAAGPGAILYAALSYDGRMALDPPDPFDKIVHALFDRHQRSDKGFGLALGPDAPAALVRLAAATGAVVKTARSDWRLGSGETPLLRLLLKGWAAAAREISPDQADKIAAWKARRSALLDSGRLRVRIGHRDVLACW